MSTHTSRGWQPERTWVVVVGLLEWQDPETFAPFPQERRRDEALVRFFKQAGVPQQQIVYLRDHQATHARVCEKLEQTLPKASPGDTLFFYYCGHGYQTDSGAGCFSPYDACCEGVDDWEMAWVPKTIERLFRGDRAILTADCCYSGNLASAVVRRRSGRIAYACMTSSSASELSTGNWTFTEALLAGLHGHAFTDTNSSATITLGELADEILGDMAFAEEQLASFVTAGAFDTQLVIAPARPRPHPSVGRRAEVLSEGDWYKARIIDARGDEFRVHYYGWEESDDEWVGEDRIRDVTPVQYAPGTRVEVHWKRKWYPAKVIHVRGGIHYIQYDDYGEEWSEWAASKRIRRPQS